MTQPSRRSAEPNAADDRVADPTNELPPQKNAKARKSKSNPPPPRRKSKRRPRHHQIQYLRYPEPVHAPYIRLEYPASHPHPKPVAAPKTTIIYNGLTLPALKCTRGLHRPPPYTDNKSLQERSRFASSPSFASYFVAKIARVHTIAICGQVRDRARAFAADVLAHCSTGEPLFPASKRWFCSVLFFCFSPSCAIAHAAKV